MPDIYTQTFWDEIDAEMWAELSPLLVTIYVQGIEEGAITLPAGVQPLMDWDGVNTAALDWAKRYRYDWIKGITETTRNQTRKAVADWIQSGAPLDALEESIAGIFGESRAARIAATEATRIFSEANAQAWKSTGLVEKVRFNTSRDDRVCKLCGPLNGLLFDVNDYGHKPPIHVGCRCFNTPVVSEEALNRQLEEILA